jgi:hypothetical protein
MLRLNYVAGFAKKTRADCLGLVDGLYGVEFPVQVVYFICQRIFVDWAGEPG